MCAKNVWYRLLCCDATEDCGKHLSHGCDSSIYNFAPFHDRDSIDDHNTGIFHVFEMRSGMNKLENRILALIKQQQERPVKIPRSGLNFQAFLAAAEVALDCDNLINSARLA